VVCGTRAVYGENAADPVVIDGKVFFSSGVHRCIEYATGREMWCRQLGFGSVIATRCIIYFAIPVDSGSAK